ncbi:hypothetical protein CBF90_13300 [Microbacterium sp. AISO3]|jgi:DnaK suppressor protein|uniref:TraR/DksA family transcriptional regulator n=2 Tax=unclassified Microbacterium TaxID=2609290 RepID=UPI000B4C7CB5|nr:TraR/DksA family transcriptional regulator [Microbacterium sp. AISO3]OWP21137.1 hypothetical protein CBF90_13300 [Microbacterium sp. AISO3]QCR39792.1 hypothetical protein C1N74_04705 [Microbacterium sp. SGAir0570]
MEKTAEAASSDVRTRLEALLAERRELLADIEPRAVPSVDPVAYQAAASHRATITLISEALGRVRAGSYGQCVGCGRAIAPARLEAVPYAPACIECQSRAETA